MSSDVDVYVSDCCVLHYRAVRQAVIIHKLHSTVVKSAITELVQDLNINASKKQLSVLTLTNTTMPGGKLAFLLSVFLHQIDWSLTGMVVPNVAALRSEWALCCSAKHVCGKSLSDADRCEAEVARRAELAVNKIVGRQVPRGEGGVVSPDAPMTEAFTEGEPVVIGTTSLTGALNEVCDASRSLNMDPEAVRARWVDKLRSAGYSLGSISPGSVDTDAALQQFMCVRCARCVLFVL